MQDPQPAGDPLLQPTYYAPSGASDYTGGAPPRDLGDPMPEIEPIDSYFGAQPPFEEELDLDLDDEDFDDLAPDDLDTDELPLEEDVVSPWRKYMGWIITVVVALLTAFLIRHFILHAFYVEYDSMQPTLLPNDRILVNKLDRSPSRGDLLVFSRTDGDLIKRAIALENETIYFEDGYVKIGEQWLQEPYLKDDTRTQGASQSIPGCLAVDGVANDGSSCRIPKGYVFVMGDNRPYSLDSRNFGPVSLDSIIGTAFFQIWPLGDMRAF